MSQRSRVPAVLIVLLVVLTLVSSCEENGVGVEEIDAGSSASDVQSEDAVSAPLDASAEIVEGTGDDIAEPAHECDSDEDCEAFLGVSGHLCCGCWDATCDLEQHVCTPFCADSACCFAPSESCSWTGSCACVENDNCPWGWVCNDEGLCEIPPEGECGALGGCLCRTEAGCDGLCVVVSQGEGWIWSYPGGADDCAAESLGVCVSGVEDIPASDRAAVCVARSEGFVIEDLSGEVRPETALALYCQAAADQMVAFNAQAGPVPDHLQAIDAPLDGSEFDISVYWDAFAHIALEDGWVMDYVYDYTELGGDPRLYVRPDGSERLLTWSELMDASYEGLGWSDLHPNDRMVFDGSPESYIEALVFRRLAGEFYKHWHSFSFRRVICTAAARDALLDAIPEPCQPLSEGQREAIQAIDPTPSVDIQETGIRVRFGQFSVWAGFSVRTYVFDPDNPTEGLRHDPEQSVEVPYQCGVTF